MNSIQIIACIAISVIPHGIAIYKSVFQSLQNHTLGLTLYTTVIISNFSAFVNNEPQNNAEQALRLYACDAVTC